MLVVPSAVRMRLTCFIIFIWFSLVMLKFPSPFDKLVLNCPPKQKFKMRKLTTSK